MIGIFFKSLRIGDVTDDGSSRYFLIYLLLITENMYKSLAMCYLAPMTSSKPCGTMQLFLQWFLSTNISKGSLAARIWRWSCRLSFFFSCTGRQRLLVQEKTVWFFRVLWIVGFFSWSLSDKGGVYQELFQRYGPFKRRNHLTVKLFQRQGLFNGSDLWCGSFNGKNLSTVKYFNSKDINGMNLQRHGFLHGRGLGFGFFHRLFPLWLKTATVRMLTALTAL